MSYESIAFANANGIARITLNRPDRLNSFTRGMHAELRDALANLGEARVVVLKFFGGHTNLEIARHLGLGERTVDRLWACAKARLFRSVKAPR